ncbi:MAG: hypothetical protein B5M46_04120 [Epsilonproteobacteria bacterium 4484_20]|nr:MAG: hypothetical protein B5M46_04120 [Epsilonproteobacteria bacterium 4484_20]
MKKSQPIRMCITCRSRHPQKSLIRFFYLCRNCVNNEKKLKGLAKRFKQDLEQLARLLGALV